MISIERRDGNRKRYDLTERLFPAELLAEHPAERDQLRHLLLSRHRAHGLLGTAGDDAEFPEGTVPAHVRHDRLGAVSVVNVPVEDRDATDPLGCLRPARCDRGRVEQAEPHRPSRLRVMPGRPRQRKAAASHRLDRSTGCTQRGVERRLAAERVGIEPAARPADAVDERRGVTAQHVVLGRRHTVDEREAVVEHAEAGLRLGVAAGGVEIGGRGMTYDLHPCAPSP